MTKIPSIYQLRQEGWKVFVCHFRMYPIVSLEGVENPVVCPEWLAEELALIMTSIVPPEQHRFVLPRGGLTAVIMTSPTGDNYEGVSVCSLEDNFNRKVGLSIAMGRALYSQPESLEDYKEILNFVREQFNERTRATEATA